MQISTVKSFSGHRFNTALNLAIQVINTYHSLRISPQWGNDHFVRFGQNTLQTKTVQDGSYPLHHLSHLNGTLSVGGLSQGEPRTGSLSQVGRINGCPSSMDSGWAAATGAV